MDYSSPSLRLVQGQGLPGPRAIRVVLAVVVVLLFLFPAGIRIAADLFWFREIGFERVFTTELAAKAALFLAVAILSWVWLTINVRVARRSPAGGPVFSGQLPDAVVELIERLPRLTTPATYVIAALAGLSATAAWMTALQFLNGQPFGATDPVFGRDIGYYTFVVPALAMLLGLLSTLTVFSALLAGFVYFVRGEIRPPAPRIFLSPRAGAHLGILVAIFLVLAAARIWIVQIPELLYSTTGPLTGASYTDLHARRPGLHITAVVALLGAGLILAAVARRRVLPAAPLAVIAYIVVGLAGRQAYPAIVQKLVVSPTELTRERPFLAHHIAATRVAWGIDSVATRDLPGDVALTLNDIRNNGPTIENVRLWDREPLLQTFGQLQEIRTYYDFINVDDDRYLIGGRYRQVLLSARELNTGALPTRSFIADHLTFTHGMGITLAPVNQVTTEGLPVLFVKDLPPASTVSLSVTRPQIYFGELTNSYVIVGTQQPEFDHPSGDSSLYAAYQGRAGVPLTFLRRAVLAWHFASLRMLLSGDITAESRILYNRNISRRAARALPFLRFDGDPYLVVTDAGELVWILDAYTSTTRYPYAARLADGTTYMRNSVKVTIDAYHGTVRAYIADAADPLIRTQSRIFPGILSPLDSMPADLRRHLRYPEDLYRAQAALYTTYHMIEPDLFYNREDQWQIPMMEQGRDRNPFMRHLVMRLPDEQQAEYIFMTPFTPRQKDNLAAWMVARSDGEHYGKLLVYRFPKQSLIFGPRQIMNRINQDTEIARQITLWDQRGSEVIRGELLVIPIEKSLIYVQPIYLRAEGGQIPELKRVVLAHQNQVVMAETLDAGLTLLFGGDAGRPSVVADQPSAPAAGAAPATGVNATLVRQIQEAYDRAIAAQRAGNWALYGEEMNRLGDLVRRLSSSSPPR
ncbi:MAG: UPF0182 family protein [Gemmatimonadaceae bacterium]|nr:UPF0182 family protein [Gemmatimonadaceae bacterium]